MGTGEMIFIFLLGLIIFGPKKLPEIGRQVGKMLTEFKRASNEFKSQLETEINQLEEEPKKATVPELATPQDSTQVVAPEAETPPAEQTDPRFEAARLAFAAQNMGLRPPEQRPVTTTVLATPPSPAPAEAKTEDVTPANPSSENSAEH